MARTGEVVFQDTGDVEFQDTNDVVWTTEITVFFKKGQAFASVARKLIYKGIGREKIMAGDGRVKIGEDR